MKINLKKREANAVVSALESEITMVRDRIETELSYNEYEIEPTDVSEDQKYLEILIEVQDYILDTAYRNYKNF